jgi:hypothetical protein
VSRRACVVTFTDILGVRHSVEVDAESVYHAAVAALQALRGHAWNDGLGPATRLIVEVQEPTVKHIVTIDQLRRWADSAATSPAEKIKKDHARSILGPPKSSP